MRTLAVSHRVLAFEACSARPASKVLRWTLAGYSGLVVWRLSRGKYIILCESRAQRALNGTRGPPRKKSNATMYREAGARLQVY